MSFLLLTQYYTATLSGPPLYTTTKHQTAKLKVRHPEDLMDLIGRAVEAGQNNLSVWLNSIISTVQSRVVLPIAY